MTHRIIAFLLTACVFVATVFAQPTRYAVLIGVDDYTKLVKLRYAQSDTKALRNELYKIGFAEENVYCLTSGGDQKSLPTKENIETTVTSVLRRAKEGDVVVIAMSGHGIEANGQARFCPLDTKEDNLLATTVPIGDIFSAFEQCKATFKLMLIDACRENPFTSRNLAGASVMQPLSDPPKGIMLLQSCAKGELSYEDADLKQGIFTHYLIEGLQGKAADQEGNVTLLLWAAYAIEKTQQRAFDKFRATQRPYLRGEITDFVLTTQRTFTSQELPKPAVVPTIPDGRRVNVSTAAQLLYAVQNAKDGDVVVLAVGTYELNDQSIIIDNGKKNIVLYGDPNHPPNVKIRIVGENCGIKINNRSQAKLIGLDISCKDSGGVDTKNRSQSSILFCNIHDCYGAGIRCFEETGAFDTSENNQYPSEYAKVFLESCTITGNNSGIWYIGSVEANNCRISNNKDCGVSTVFGGGGRVNLTGCEINNNEMDGIRIHGTDDFATVVGCTIKNNRYGVWFRGTSGGDFRNTVISGNKEQNWINNSTGKVTRDDR